MGALEEMSENHQGSQDLSSGHRGYLYQILRQDMTHKKTKMLSAWKFFRSHFYAREHKQNMAAKPCAV